MKQRAMLREVFAFSSRDDLETAQLTGRLWWVFVTENADKLALRPFQHVLAVRFCLDSL